MKFENFLLICVFLIFAACYFGLNHGWPHCVSLAFLIAVAIVFGLVNGEHKTEQRLKQEQAET